MPSYLVETYLPRGRTRERAGLERQARSAAEELAQGKARVSFNHSIHVPEDEICFFVFEASSSRVAALAARRAGLEPLRIVSAISSGGTRRRHE
jgi:hypothetical protein